MLFLILSGEVHHLSKQNQNNYHSEHHQRYSFINLFFILLPTNLEANFNDSNVDQKLRSRY